jgi:hypothetical protein
MGQSMGQSIGPGQDAWNAAQGGYSREEQHRRAQDILRNANKTGNQKRGQSVWDAALRNSQGHNKGKHSGQEMCGDEPLDFDAYPAERESMEEFVNGSPRYPAEPESMEELEKPDMCGADECGFDLHLEERSILDDMLRDSPGRGPEDPGPGLGPQGPSGPTPP